MREIKFRAWNRNSMFTPQIIDGDNNKVYSFVYGDSYLEEIDNTILMQYTGLKDKNGKEIYEGDIVRWKAGDHFNVYGGTSKEDRINIVEYVKVGFNPFIHSEGYGGVEMIDVEDCEVLGNVYENPELIK